MGAIVDTSVLIEPWRPYSPRNAATTAWFVAADPDEPLAIAAITVAELLAGVERLAPSPERDAEFVQVTRLIATWTVLPLDIPESRVFRRVLRQLQHQGLTPGAADLMIAATALVRAWSVVTFNPKHFTIVPDLQVIVPELSAAPP